MEHTLCGMPVAELADFPTTGFRARTLSRFQRDQGYFLGAMYVSYPISAVLICGMLWLAHLLWPDVHLNWLLFLVVLPLFLPMVPLVFRYSRTLWIYFDHGVEPTGSVDLHGWEQWCRIWEEKEK